MNYLLRDDPINAKPRKLLPEAKSLVTLLVNYYTEPPLNPGLDFGKVASYAVGLDYHKVIKKKIKLFQEKLQKEIGITFYARGFSDAVPLLEKSFARNSGLGFYGKHTLIINKPYGSYFFICEMLSELDIEPTEPKQGTCGKCTRCIDVCPTEALNNGLVNGKPLLDSRLCISYLTIENKNSIPIELRENIGNWVYGCDLCQIVCPYNKKLKETTWKEFKPESGVGHYLNLSEVLSIKTDEEFHSKFCHTALTRAGRKGLIRNAAIVAGNNLSSQALPKLMRLAEEEYDPVIREHVLWALSKYPEKGAKIISNKYHVSGIPRYITTKML